MKKFVLKRDGVDKSVNDVFPDLNPANIPSRYALDREQNYFSVFLPVGTLFKGMIPQYIGDNPPQQVHAICDMHSFIREKPPGWMYPVSERFKELLEGFNMPNTRFYEGSVIWNEKEYPYYVWHLLTEKYEHYIDFSKSRFVKTTGELYNVEGNPIQAESIKDVKEKLESYFWAFQKAVMFPEFRETDVCEIEFYGILISERLKEAIESAALTNISITPCPIEFEVSDQV
jgi:hypothetical protein